MMFGQFSTVVAATLVILSNVAMAEQSTDTETQTDQSSDTEILTDQSTDIETTAEQSTDKVSALVNGEPVFSGSLDIIVNILSEEKDLTKESILDELINLKVLSQAAKKQSLDTDQTVAIAIELQTDQTLANAYTEFYSNNIEVSVRDLKDEYDRHVERLEKQDFRVSHILLANRDDANNIFDELNSGADYGSLQSEHSIDPLKDLGGDLGWFSYDSDSLPHSDVLQRLKVNEHTMPLETSYGWHVFKITDVRGANVPSYESIRDDLYATVVKTKMAEHLQSLKEQSLIEIPD